MVVDVCNVFPLDARPVGWIHFALPALHLHHTTFFPRFFFSLCPLFIRQTFCLLSQLPLILPFLSQSSTRYQYTAPNMSKPARGWNDEAHTALLICLLDEIKGGKPVITKATERLNQMGYQYSYDAVKYYILILPSQTRYSGRFTIC